MSAHDPAWPLGTVTVLGAHILDVLGRPVEAIPPGQGSVRLREIRATAAGTAAGTGVDLAKLGARVRAAGALGDDLLGDIVIAAMARHGVDTTGLVRKDWFMPNEHQVLALTGRTELTGAIKDVLALGTAAVAGRIKEHIT